ncbi:hypothetical protein GCM10022393_41080 [Aquimarina addita]|uniref:YtxH-like protein n=1 Tax=Aquimarina addita TaxID=870485 RepID=A0ABP6UUG2_9FLAO
MKIRKRTKKHPIIRRVEEHIDVIEKFTHKSDAFFNKPIVKKVGKTILITGAVFGGLFLSKYFLSATAKMIKSCKEIKDAWKR